MAIQGGAHEGLIGLGGLLQDPVGLGLGQEVGGLGLTPFGAVGGQGGQGLGGLPRLHLSQGHVHPEFP